jgi:gluconate 2-dehydrogenase gamma chain
MSDPAQTRRGFLKGALAGGALAGTALPPLVQAHSLPTTQAAPPAYVFFTPLEATFIEALVNHMVPADAAGPGGVELGINVYIDRALAGEWGSGDRLYMQGPWKQGAPSQGYQLALTPAQLYRAGIAATERHAVATHGAGFAALSAPQKERMLQGLDSGTVVFDNALPAPVFFAILYQTIVEGMFADPIYGGNVDKAAWKMIGFPGVIGTNAHNIKVFKNKRFQGQTFSIADVS